MMKEQFEKIEGLYKNGDLSREQVDIDKVSDVVQTIFGVEHAEWLTKRSIEAEQYEQALRAIVKAESVEETESIAVEALEGNSEENYEPSGEILDLVKKAKVKLDEIKPFMNRPEGNCDLQWEASDLLLSAINKMESEK